MIANLIGSSEEMPAMASAPPRAAAQHRSGAGPSVLGAIGSSSSAFVQEPLPDVLRRRICCIVPCYNVAAYCAPVILECARHAGLVIAVDDGSTDSTELVLSRLEQELGDRLRVLTFPENRGKGAALMKGLRHFLRQTDCDVAVTIDADGQHRPGDIARVALPCLLEEADLVIAQRQFPNRMPMRSRLGNEISAAILGGVFRGAPRDTQCGLRAHGRAFVASFFPHVHGRRYETESAILMLALRSGRRIAQTPIPAIYIGRNESSHYRPIRDSLRILWTFVTVLTAPMARLGGTRDMIPRRPPIRARIAQE